MSDDVSEQWYRLSTQGPKSEPQPKKGDRFQLRGTPIIAKVKAISIGWIEVEVSSDSLSMQYREKAQTFALRWIKIKDSDPAGESS